MIIVLQAKVSLFIFKGQSLRIPAHYGRSLKSLKYQTNMSEDAIRIFDSIVLMVSKAKSFYWELLFRYFSGCTKKQEKDQDLCPSIQQPLLCPQSGSFLYISPVLCDGTIFVSFFCFMCLLFLWIL